MICEEICDRKLALEELASPIKLYPQYTKNVKVKDKAAAVNDEAVLNEISEVEKLINGKGRTLLRQSGTEPVIRVMIEAESEQLCTEYADRVVAIIRERGHCVE